MSSAWWVLVAAALAGCGPRQLVQSEGHIQSESRPAAAGGASIPAPVRAIPMPPPPQAADAEIRYSVVVANQPVREVLLAMARETRVNFDIHPGIEGSVNLNAIDQTLKQILTRIARQVDVRWETDGQTITVMPDTPFLRTYRVDYVNMNRDVVGTVGVQSQVSPSLVGTGGTGSSPGASQNTSVLRVDNSAKNRFWETLEKNLRDLLRETDKLLPEGSSETFVQTRGQGQIATTQSRTTPARRASATTSSGATTTTTTTTPGTETTQQESVEQRLTFREAASVIVNPESGLVAVRATSRQQEKVAEFLANVMSAARRQVLIEATVVEVILNDQYQAGVDWSSMRLGGLGYSFRQNLLAGSALAGNEGPFFSIQYTNPAASIGGSITSSVKMLDSFGNTRVLSSPRIMAINNQTAVLKIVDNLVYFSVSVTPAQVGPNGNVTSPAIITTSPNLVPVGFVLNVTPQIADNDMVVLNIRPTITSSIDTVIDPNPNFSGNRPNIIPIIRSREFESVLRVPSGRIAIIGGLMEDSFRGSKRGLPILSRFPVVGDAVSYRDDTAGKRELVVFLRPIVISDPSIDGDLADYRRHLPNQEFFRSTRSPMPQFEEGIERLERTPLRTDPVPVVPAPPRPEVAP